MSNRATIDVADYWVTAVRFAAMSAEADRTVDSQKTLNELEMGFNTSLTPATATEIIQVISRLESATTPELKESRTALKSAVRAALTANPEALSSLVQATVRTDASINADLRDSRKRLLALIRKPR